MTNRKYCKLTKHLVDQDATWKKGSWPKWKLTKQRVDEMHVGQTAIHLFAYWSNETLPKWQVDKKAGWLNSKWTKWQSGKTESWQNASLQNNIFKGISVSQPKMTDRIYCKWTKLQVKQAATWQREIWPNGKLTKVQARKIDEILVCKTASCLVYLCVDQITNWTNVKLTKEQVDQMASWQKCKLAAWRVVEIPVGLTTICLSVSQSNNK